MAKKNDEKSEKLNPIMRLFFVFILPAIVALLLAVIVLSIGGINVVGWAKDKAQSVPVVSSLIKTDEEKNIMEELEQANEKIAEQNEELESLKAEIEQLEAIAKEQELEMKKMTNEKESEESIKEIEEEKENLEVKQIAASFKKMDKEKAARIVESLHQSTAVEILSNVSGDVRGGILEEMDPKVAAKLMEDMVIRKQTMN